MFPITIKFVAFYRIAGTNESFVSNTARAVTACSCRPFGAIIVGGERKIRKTSSSIALNAVRDVNGRKHSGFG